MKQRVWSSGELDFITSNYQNMTRAAMAKAIDCPLSVLSRKMKELGLKKRPPEPEVGDEFERLTIREKKMVWTGQQHKTVAVCECRCGNSGVEVRLTSLVQGRTVSCGCWKNEKAAERTAARNFKHGKSKGSRLYRIWTAMKSRCYTPGTECYDDYGGRGIVVCDEWRDDFLAFERWSLANGYADDLTIDRENVNGNYEPTNCRWVIRKVQAQNKRNSRSNVVTLTAFGETKTIQEWLSDPRCNVSSATTICYRVGVGWTTEDAISKKSQRVA